MMAKLIPILLGLLGLSLGVGGGIYVRPTEHHSSENATPSEEEPVGTEFVKLNNQFVVPILENEHVVSMVIMSLSLEVTLGSTESVFSREPKLRDAMLQIMFDHANAGGFNGVFTDGANLILLRKALLEIAQKIMGGIIKDVLISDLARQDS